jgi:FkbM family methyltransferase
MFASLKHALHKVPVVPAMSARLRSLKARRDGGKVFENADEYARAFYRKSDDGVVLRTHDGLNVAIRRNRWDAEIVREIFFDRPYTRHVQLPPKPVIVDVGGYIGDFALYAVKYLDAARVVAYEPTQENFAMLRRNVELNGYDDRITAVKKAVGTSGETVLNVQKRDGDEVHVSAYWYPEAERRVLPSVSLSEVLHSHGLESVDLLKVDCEGGEYDIFPAAPDDVFERIGNIVFEYHAIDGYRSKLDRVMSRLASAGYALRDDNQIVTASPA